MFHPDGPSLLDLVRQALSSTERGYDLLAPKFDWTPFRTPDSVIAPMVAAAGARGSVDDGLDLMCGTGAILRAMLPLCRRRAAGIDFSAGMLAEAERRLAGEPGRARVELVRGDVLSMSYAGEFDLALSAGAFGHIRVEDEPLFLENVRRALRPGGRFVFPTGEAPPLTSPRLWAARGFNAAMRLRNAIFKPPFVMYYLTMLWPDVHGKLARAGFDVEVRRDLFAAPFERAIVVVATRRT